MGCGNAFGKLSINARYDTGLTEYEISYKLYNRIDWFASACNLIKNMHHLRTLYVKMDKEELFNLNEAESLSRILINLFENSRQIENLVIQGRMEIFDCELWEPYWKVCRIPVNS